MAAIAVLGAVAAIVAGCGDQAEPTTPSAPVASESPTSGDDPTSAAEAEEPGAPAEGQPAFFGLGTWWIKLPKDERIASAVEFAAASPEDCSGVSPTQIELQTLIAYGYDFPETTPAGAVMAESCALIRAGP